MSDAGNREPLDLLVVGAGPTGIAIGAEAKAAGLDVLLVDRGPLCAAIVEFPSSMLFFTTRDKLEIAGIPFGIPDDKPNRRQALAYYQGVARQHQLPLALYQEVLEIKKGRDGHPGGGQAEPPPGGGQAECPPGGGQTEPPPGGGPAECPPGGGPTECPPGGGQTECPPGGGQTECPPGGGQTEYFMVTTRSTAAAGEGGGARTRCARAVALATGYWSRAKRLGVSGEDLPWVHARYLEPYSHFGQHVVVVGGGNSASETALDLWRNNVRVTMIVRQSQIKPTVKYWVAPDVSNRIAEGSIGAHFQTAVAEFSADGTMVIDGPSGRQRVAADAAYVLIGYLPDAELELRCGITVDPETLVPSFDPGTCESNVPGLYVCGTLQAGRDTGRIFIENSRRHAPKIVSHLLRRRRAANGV